MIRAAILLLGVGCVLPMAPGNISNQSMALSPARIRFVLDVAGIQLPLQLKAGAAWCLVTIEPDRKSGKGSADGPYIDGTTGKLVIPPGGKFVVTYSGNCKVKEALLGTAQPGEEWAYVETVEMGTDQPPPLHDHNYSPLYGGGIMLCELNLAESGLKRFERQWTIPQSWAADITEAFKQFATGRPKPPVDPRVGANVVELAATLHGNNKFISLVAAKRLSAMQSVSRAVSAADLLSMDSVLAGAIVHIVVRDPSDVDWKALHAIVMDAIAKITKVEQCEGLLLGLLANRSRSSAEPARSRNSEVSAALAARIEALDASVRDRADVKQIIETLRAGGAATRKSEEK